MDPEYLQSADLTDLMADEDEANAEPNAKAAEVSSKEVSEEANQSTKQAQSTDEDMTEPEVRNTSTLSIKSRGHPIGLRASYPKSWIRTYQVEITKPASWAMSSMMHSIQKLFDIHPANESGRAYHEGTEGTQYLRPDG